MRSLDDKFFNSKKINNPEKIFGGRMAADTCVMTSENGGHWKHDSDKKDADPAVA